MFYVFARRDRHGVVFGLRAVFRSCRTKRCALQSAAVSALLPVKTYHSLLLTASSAARSPAGGPLLPASTKW